MNINQTPNFAMLDNSEGISVLVNLNKINYIEVKRTRAIVYFDNREEMEFSVNEIMNLYADLNKKRLVSEMDNTALISAITSNK